ncbi:SH3 domain-containing protein [Rhodobacteraceae bacterium F11138]|nr:SH3 domain-containing protein [Rhodobacteraceae bacterium F11138]
MRFVLSAFAILGLVFYELSGGADFQPPEPPVVASKPQPAAAARTAQARPAASASAKTAKSTRTARTQPATLVAATVPAVAVDATRSRENLNRVRSSLSQGLTLLPDSNPTDGLTMASLQLGAAGLSTTAAVEPEQPAPQPVAVPVAVLEQTPKDLREISGTRVNMRDGPGTIYPVLTRLSIGQQVEVLGDSGTGWLRLRTMPNGQLGWVSASLVGKARR